ncbi:Heme-binding protein involved in regulation of cytochrome P450 protein Erg11p [Ogataea parapolymorpha DL-1]|uniref:Heme-binding protein involved in regulation of cytochrome P450 protein Erg11p n=1 Tax=Ogataea parapolymorpha (strain ATCC 26012 / BCRC 20466 / JCM 22074 / NRRL Y-7560 / DL-1) TaxID=871575 RepID=W1QDK0_OGAPD|nr:Heme-binding protein involved in regulation of cytochrome P450 protein Erg11p [Ogataea parapolymorpha DL-1]ESW99534.1 Heme-binding protein involved in regulation of cytochrome P450 protein Erg11p [Ogataea parapolymorpha DL-1]
METLVLVAIVVILATFFLGSTIFAPSRTVEINPAADDVAVEEQEFTPRTLYKYNGFDLEQIYIAVKGNVYDVSKSRQFYGPSGPYSNFAGHDASRGLAKNSFDESMVRDFGEPIDDLKDLTEAEWKALDGWEETFKSKYPKVGVLVEEKK